MRVGEVLRVGGQQNLRNFYLGWIRDEKGGGGTLTKATLVAPEVRPEVSQSDTVGSKVERGLGAARPPAGSRGGAPVGVRERSPRKIFGKITHFCHVFHDF